jgi:antitoxin CcdA
MRLSDEEGYQMPDQDKAKDCDPTEATEADRRREAALWKERNAGDRQPQRVGRAGRAVLGKGPALLTSVAMRTLDAHIASMATIDEGRAPRHATNLTLSAEATRRAKEYGLNISRIAEDAIVEAVRRHEGELWKQRNAEAIRSYNEWVAEEGLPFAKFRQF